MQSTDGPVLDIVVGNGERLLHSKDGFAIEFVVSGKSEESKQYTCSHLVSYSI